MWAKIFVWLETKALGLSVKVWCYIFGALLVLASYAYVYSKGESHCREVISSAIVKQQTAEAKKEEKRTAEAVKNASSEADKLNQIAADAATNTEKAHDIAKDAEHPISCDLTDAERVYLKSVLDRANQGE